MNIDECPSHTVNSQESTDPQHVSLQAFAVGPKSVFLNKWFTVVTKKIAWT